MALAYRALALQQHELLSACADILAAVDRRLIAFDNPAILAKIDGTLKEIGADTPTSLDVRFREWGETWHAEIPVHYEEDDYVTSKEAGPLLNITPDSIGRLRIDGRIKGKWDPTLGSKGGWTYRVGDLWKLSTEKRGRGNWRSKDPTVSIGDTGEVTPNA
jgi:hypothetical protein